MSRSYKKVAGWTAGYGGNRKLMKRLANKKVRNTEDVSNGKMYKRVFCSWYICDFKFLEFWDSRAATEAEARRK